VLKLIGFPSQADVRVVPTRPYVHKLSGVVVLAFVVQKNQRGSNSSERIALSRSHNHFIPVLSVRFPFPFYSYSHSHSCSTGLPKLCVDGMRHCTVRVDQPLLKGKVDESRVYACRRVSYMCVSIGVLFMTVHDCVDRRSGKFHHTRIRVPACNQLVKDSLCTCSLLKSDYY
jgi:hypothetical protein